MPWARCRQPHTLLWTSRPSGASVPLLVRSAFPEPSLSPSPSPSRWGFPVLSVCPLELLFSAPCLPPVCFCLSRFGGDFLQWLLEMGRLEVK